MLYSTCWNTLRIRKRNEISRDGFGEMREIERNGSRDNKHVAISGNG